MLSCGLPGHVPAMRMVFHHHAYLNSSFSQHMQVQCLSIRMPTLSRFCGLPAALPLLPAGLSNTSYFTMIAFSYLSIPSFVLAWSDPRHVVVLGECREVFVQLLHALFVRFDAFALESFLEL